MAFERDKSQVVVASNLDGFIQGQLTLLRNAIIQRNLDEESRFQTAVLADHLSLEDQLAYRKTQLKSVDSDPEEVRRLRGEISSLKGQIDNKKITDGYLSELEKQNSGMQSIDATVAWVKDTLNKTTDPKMRDSLQSTLTQMEQQRFTLQKDTLDKQTTFATADKSEKIIKDQIAKVTSAKTKAILAGDDNYSSVLDLQLQVLNKTLNESKITSSISSLAVSSITGQSAVATLDKINSELTNADSTTPIVVGGVQYKNAQDFWTAKRTDFLNDNSASGFFPRLQGEVADAVDYKVSKGIFKTGDLSGITQNFNDIKTRPELADYQNKLDQTAQTTLGKYAQTRADQILNQFAIDLDANKAVTELSGIQNFYGVDMSTNYQKLILSASQHKDEQMKSILSATADIMSKNPGMTQDKAFQQAVQQGAGATLSPEALATKSPTEAFKDLSTQTKETAGPNMTVPPETGVGIIKPAFNEGDIVKTPSSALTYKYEAGVLRPIEGYPTEDLFKQATGKSYGDIKTVPALGNIPIGAVIPTQAVTPAGQPGLNPPTPQPDKPLTNTQPGLQMPTAGSGAQPAAPVGDSYTVSAGDTLSKIAQRYYNDPKKYQAIYDANKDVLKNPNQIKPGQTLKIPKL